MSMRGVPEAQLPRADPSRRDVAQLAPEGLREAPTARAGFAWPMHGEEFARPLHRPLTSLEALERVKGGARVTTPAGEPAFEHHAELDVTLETATATLWSELRPRDGASLTPGALNDLARMQAIMAEYAGGALPFKFHVLASRTPGIFSLGMAPALLANLVGRRDRRALEAHALACARVLHRNARACDLPLVTLALVEGDALGTGFDAVLSCDVVIAERGTRFGAPEVLFDLFPSLTGYSFLSRRVGAAEAERMLFGGRLFTAQELFEREIVQVLAEPGQGRAALREFIGRSASRHNAHQAIHRARRCVHPLGFNELERMAAVWVEAALAMRDTDLRDLEHFVAVHRAGASRA